MFKLLSIYLLVVLVALQSFAAFADDHTIHQQGSEHLSFNSNEHQHIKDSASVVLKNIQFDQEQFDCHHCCHCHGSTHLYIATDNKMAIDRNIQFSLGKNTHYSSTGRAPDLRPPIL